MKKYLSTLLFIVALIASLKAQPTNWENFSATGCDGRTMSIKGVIEKEQKPMVLMWKGYDCGFCREEGAACALSSRTYGNIIIYWNAFGRITGNPSCREADDWKQEYNTPANDFTFLDAPAEDNWSQPAPGQGRWYWVISQDKTTKQLKMVYSGNIIKDAENIARRSTRDFITANESSTKYLSNFKLFPNPSSENINLEMNLISSAEVEIEILDMMGKSVKKLLKGTFNQVAEVIDIQGLAKGMYVLKYKINDTIGSEVFTVK